MVGVKIVFTLKFCTNFDCFSLGWKSPKVELGAFHPTLRDPLPSCPIKANTNATASAVAAKGAISIIYALIGWAKIAPAIVGSISVDVIDLAFWPISIHYHERDPMAGDLNAFDPPLLIAVRADAR